MNKVFKRILLVSGIIVGMIGLFLLVIMIKAKSEVNNMTPLETKNLFENISVIKDTYVNMFLLKDEERYIAIDAGNDIDVIEEELKKLKISPNKVTTILLTHSDFDHVAAIELFKNANIYLSKQEEQLMLLAESLEVRHKQAKVP